MISLQTLLILGVFFAGTIIISLHCKMFKSALASFLLCLCVINFPLETDFLDLSDQPLKLKASVVETVLVDFVPVRTHWEKKVDEELACGLMGKYTRTKITANQDIKIKYSLRHGIEAFGLKQINKTSTRYESSECVLPSHVIKR